MGAFSKQSKINLTDYVTNQSLSLKIDEIRAVSGFNSEYDTALKWAWENGLPDTMGAIDHPGSVILTTGKDLLVVKNNIETIESLLRRFGLSIERLPHRHSKHQEYIVVNRKKSNQAPYPKIILFF